MRIELALLLLFSASLAIADHESPAVENPGTVGATSAAAPRPLRRDVQSAPELDQMEAAIRLLNRFNPPRPPDSMQEMARPIGESSESKDTTTPTVSP